MSGVDTGVNIVGIKIGGEYGMIWASFQLVKEDLFVANFY